jgi:hypothetical protein
MTDLPSPKAILTLRQGIEIAHHVPGRIRLRLAPTIWGWAQSLGLDAAAAGTWLRPDGLPAVAGVTAARLNAAAASLVIEYDPRQLDPTWWETLILGDDDEAMIMMLGMFANR